MRSPTIWRNAIAEPTPDGFAALDRALQLPPRTLTTSFVEWIGESPSRARTWESILGPLDPAPPTAPEPERSHHRCDDRCTCPVDGLPMFYAPSAGQHACQDPDCEYARPADDPE